MANPTTKTDSRLQESRLLETPQLPAWPQPVDEAKTTPAYGCRMLRKRKSDGLLEASLQTLDCEIQGAGWS
jgi:hypothetical protein